MKNNNKIETLINTIAKAEVVEVSFNKYTRNAEITVRIENSDIELKDVIFAQSTYSTNTTKAEKYADLFESKYTDTRRICKHISETVDFDKYNYCVEIEIKKSAKGTIYFVVRDYKRVEVEAEVEAEAEAEAEVKLIDEQAIETLIKTNVRNFLADYKRLGKSQINKIVAGEAAEPCGWGNPSGKDPVVVYYSNLEDSNVMLNFIDHVQSRYGIYLKNYV